MESPFLRTLISNAFLCSILGALPTAIFTLANNHEVLEKYYPPPEIQTYFLWVAFSGIIIKLLIGWLSSKTDFIKKNAYVYEFMANQMILSVGALVLIMSGALLSFGFIYGIKVNFPSGLFLFFYGIMLLLFSVITEVRFVQRTEILTRKDIIEFTANYSISKMFLIVFIAKTYKYIKSKISN